MWSQIKHMIFACFLNPSILYRLILKLVHTLIGPILCALQKCIDQNNVNNVWNGQKCDRKWFSESHLWKKITKIKIVVSNWNGKKCDQKWFLDIQNGWQWPFLAPPAERQRSFSNADSSVVVVRRLSSSTFHLKYQFLKNCLITFFLFWCIASLGRYPCTV